MVGLQCSSGRCGQVIYRGLDSHHVIRVTDGKIQLRQRIIYLHSEAATNRRILIQSFEFYVRGESARMER